MMKKKAEQFPDLNFISIAKHPELMSTFHKWEVMTSLGSVGSLKYRTVAFPPSEYEKPEDQYEALMDYLRGCRFSDTEYYVFVDERLVTDL